MTQEEIDSNRENNKYYIQIDAENKVIRHDPFLRDENGWIEIDFDYSYTPMTIGPVLSEYLPETNTIREVPRDYFESERAVDSKTYKVDTISKMVVQIASTGKVFDGDEASQDRMLRAIQIATITGQTETQWKMADNEIVTVTLDELKEALALAGQEMSRIWLEQ